MTENVNWLVDGAGFSSNLLILSKDKASATIEIYSGIGELINQVVVEIDNTTRIPAKFLISDQPLKFGFKSSLVKVHSESEIVVKSEYFFSESCFALNDLELVPAITKFFPISIGNHASFLILVNDSAKEVNIKLSLVTGKTIPQSNVIIKPYCNEIVNLSEEFFQNRSEEIQGGYLKIQSSDTYYMQLLESSERGYSEFYSMMG